MASPTPGGRTHPRTWEIVETCAFLLEDARLRRESRPDVTHCADTTDRPGHRAAVRRARRRRVAWAGAMRSVVRVRQFFRWANPCSTGARPTARTRLASFWPGVSLWVRVAWKPVTIALRTSLSRPRKPRSARAPRPAARVGQDVVVAGCGDVVGAFGRGGGSPDQAAVFVGEGEEAQQAGRHPRRTLRFSSHHSNGRRGHRGYARAAPLRAALVGSLSPTPVSKSVGPCRRPDRPSETVR